MGKIDREFAINKFEHKTIGNIIRSLQTVDLSYFKGNNYFISDDGTQNHLVFQPLNKYFKKIMLLLQN